MTTIAIPVILVLMALMGVNIAHYQGMTISDAFQDAQYGHNYTVDSSIFNATADEYINNPNYQNAYITSMDVSEAQQQINQGTYWDFIVRQQGGWQAIESQFDASWEPSVDSRTVTVYDTDGSVLGATFIIGLVANQYYYRNNVTVRPDLVAPSTSANRWLLFYTTDSTGSHYHTDFDGIIASTGGALHVNGIGYNAFNSNARFIGETAENVYFTPSGVENYFDIHCAYDGNDYVSQYRLTSPVAGRQGVDTDNGEEIGTATLPDGTTYPINPDGTITLPDGTVISPDSSGYYPIDISVEFPADFWAEVAKDIAEDGTTSSSGALENTDEKEILDSIRDSSADLLRFMRNDFWTKLTNFFKFDTDGIFNTDYVETSNDDIIKRSWEKVLSLFGLSADWSGV